MPPTNSRGMLKRIASPPISPPARTIEIVWAPSRGPAQAGLAPRSLTRNGMNRTLIAPTPSITTDTPPRAATSQREPAMIRRPSATAPPRPWDLAFASASASGTPRSRLTP